MEDKFWKREGWRRFWTAFSLTLLVMLPGFAAAWAAAPVPPQPAAERQRNIPIRLPDESHQQTILAAVAGEHPAFVLVRLDAVEGTLALAAIPAESVVRTENSGQTLADCYAATGPARVARLLAETLEIPVDRYVAATPETWQAILEDAGPVRVGLNGALTASQRQLAGLAEDAESWTVLGAHRFLEHLQALQEQRLPPQSAAAARAVLWAGWSRQKLELLPGLVPSGLKKYSSRLLTNLTATELLSLEQTLEFLADGQAEVTAGAMPGIWNGETGRYEFSEETLRWVQEVQGGGTAVCRDPWEKPAHSASEAQA